MLEMLSMLQQIQKHKASKTSSHSNTAFQNEKTALFSGARKEVETIVHDGVTYIDQCKARIAELRAQETSQDDHFKDLSLLWKNHDECIRGLLGTYPSLIENLSHRRAEYINDASAMLEAHAVGRQRSRRRLVMNARARMDENIENQKLATDATALIKHYKALLLS
ncbi:uncharacterized protein LAESUDRAFT_512954 [Laetiporus sulphureus 93-53]|uniref:Uncharacterized protein n=1 Tax=Laetiporus sulphureus 93-53 TaxID=1314785 RepID=A0A165FZ97_9APHY|nr:uncharacterized protein LAESUDRAFT_512954 [Laetiporus sulphureus 93-53]KZT09610.1 hypothetical protein LAESUDRAFT_512954 [Laetiporus sulphureus 93-53]